MSETTVRTHQESIFVEASTEAIYELVSDVSRTGSWSPVCKACWWDEEAEAGKVGAWFTGRNELPGRTWQTRSQVAVAERGREFAWVVGGRFVRWSFTMAPAEAGTMLTESWEFLPAGIAMFEERFGDAADAEVLARTEQALDGIPKTLAAIKRIAESRPPAEEQRRS